MDPPSLPETLVLALIVFLSQESCSSLQNWMVGYPTHQFAVVLGKIQVSMDSFDIHPLGILSLQLQNVQIASTQIASHSVIKPGSQ